MATMSLMPIEQVGARRTGSLRGGKPQKYVLDEPGRRLILATYDSSPGCVSELQRRLGVPRRVVLKWAHELGVARTNERRWTPEEIQYLEKHLHRTKLENIAKHLGRTKVAVKRKATKLGLRKMTEGYTMTALCEGLGCLPGRAKLWIEKGWLKGSRRHTDRTTNGDVWMFTDKAIRDFIIAHPGEINPRKMDWLWIVDILAGGRDGIGNLDAQ